MPGARSRVSPWQPRLDHVRICLIVSSSPIASVSSLLENTPPDPSQKEASLLYFRELLLSRSSTLFDDILALFEVRRKAIFHEDAYRTRIREYG